MIIEIGDLTSTIKSSEKKLLITYTNSSLDEILSKCINMQCILVLVQMTPKSLINSIMAFV